MNQDIDLIDPVLARNSVAAMHEILEVISRSRNDEAPVFDAILRNVAALCRVSLITLDLVNPAGTHLVYGAHWGQKFKTYDLGREAFPIDDPNQVSTSFRERRIIHTPDTRDSDLYRMRFPDRVRLVEEEGIRSYLTIPMVTGSGNVLGCVCLYRAEMDPFTAGEISLVDAFAAQAVIAIENVRQFREVQTRLAREAALAEILQVISQSRDNEAPVFEVVLRKTTELSGSPLAGIWLPNADRSLAQLVAERGELNRAFNAGQTSWPLDSQNAPPTCIREGRVVHIHDFADTDLYRSGDRIRVLSVDREGIRTFLAVPLIKDGQAIGCLETFRREVKPFAPDEIAMLQTFAAQAVIAMENVRQFTELGRLNAELEERVEAQVGEIERMGRLKRFLPAAVANSVVSSGSEAMLSSHRALLGVLFCDIRGFTAFCETAEPEETIEVLQTYHEEMGRLIETHGAGVDHRMGDGIMVLFNDPLPCDDPAGDAVRLAMAMRARMGDLCQKWKRMGHRLGFGIGVSLGYATVGMVGSGGRYDYTASGTAVNLAARLCEEAGDGEILVSPRARLAIEDAFALESRGEVTFKGIRDPVEVFCVTGTASH